VMPREVFQGKGRGQSASIVDARDETAIAEYADLRIVRTEFRPGVWVGVIVSRVTVGIKLKPRTPLVAILRRENCTGKPAACAINVVSR
jgi:hypothetical protein